MQRIGQRGFIEALLGRGWTTEQIEEVYAHRKQDRFYGLWRSMIRVINLRLQADTDARRDKLMTVYGKLARRLLTCR